MELKARCKERFEPVVQAIRQLKKDKEGLDEVWKWENYIGRISEAGIRL